MADEVKTLLRKLNRVLETRNNIIMRGHESFQQSGNPPLDLVKEANKKPKAKRSNLFIWILQKSFYFLLTIRYNTS